jgi:hypothetical protein
MRQSDEKRHARRIKLDPPCEGTLSHFPVTVVDLSTSGARLQHGAPILFQKGKKFLLEFRCEGEMLKLECCFTRTRLEPGRNRKPVYVTGVRFAETDAAGLEKLWGLMGWLAMDMLAHESLQPAGEFEIVGA